MSPPSLLLRASPATRAVWMCVAAAVLGGTTFAASCTRPATPPENSGRKVVFILLDAARGDRFGFAGYTRPTTPELDALAQRGAVFLTAIAQGSHTRASLPRMMASRYYTLGILDNFHLWPNRYADYDFIHPDPERLLLPEAFRRAGWTTAAFVAHAGVTKRSVFGQTFDVLEAPRSDTEFIYPRGELVVAAALDWMRAHRGRDAFVYIHLMDTHFPHLVTDDTEPFLPPQPWPVDHFRPNGTPEAHKTTWLTNTQRMKYTAPEDIAYLNALYDGDMRYTSRILGTFYDTLDREGLLTDALFVLTADHGEELGEHGVVSHVSGNPWDTIHHIPLLLMGPGRVPPATRITTPVESIDLYPTILDVMDIALPEGARLDGDSLAPHWSAQPPPPRPVFITPSNAWAVRTDAWVYYERHDGSRPLLYHLQDDPAQLHNRASTDPEVAAALQAVLQERMGPFLEEYATLPQTAPQRPFAVTPRWNTLVMPAAVARVSGLEPRDDAALQTDNRWALEPAHTLWTHGARETPPSIRLDFAVPPDTYKVALGMKHGRFPSSNGVEYDGSEVRVKVLGEAGWRTLRSVRPEQEEKAPAIPWWMFWKEKPRPHLPPPQLHYSYVDVGSYTVSEGTLTMEFQSVPGMWAFVYEVLLAPSAATETLSASPEDLERLQILRALGYVE